MELQEFVEAASLSALQAGYTRFAQVKSFC